MDQSQKEEKVLYDSIYELLSFENIHLQGRYELFQLAWLPKNKMQFN